MSEAYGNRRRTINSEKEEVLKTYKKSLKSLKKNFPDNWKEIVVDLLSKRKK